MTEQAQPLSWCVQWYNPDMPAPTFFYYDTEELARKRFDFCTEQSYCAYLQGYDRPLVHPSFHSSEVISSEWNGIRGKRGCTDDPGRIRITIGSN